MKDRWLRPINVILVALLILTLYNHGNNLVARGFVRLLNYPARWSQLTATSAPLAVLSITHQQVDQQSVDLARTLRKKRKKSAKIF